MLRVIQTIAPSLSVILPHRTTILHLRTVLVQQRRAAIATVMAPKRKRSVVEEKKAAPPPPKRRASQRALPKSVADPALNDDIIDGVDAARASPDAELNLELAPSLAKKVQKEKKTKKLKAAAETSAPMTNGNDGEMNLDPEAEGDEVVGEDELKQALSRPPPVNSDYLPLPWKGRLGYACLNTYLRFSNPSVFSSRTCRIASILEHRHPLKDPTQPEHPTKNRPDKEQPADIERGRRYVENLGLTNARDIVKMLRWNDRYGIKFMRLSSEMFPFASHEEYGYSLAPFAAETLAEVGKVVAELGHRVTTHPGQFTQLGSPRKTVIDNAVRDLIYHDEMLSLLKLPPQQNRDAVMILHMGGTFGDKPATLDRFRENYAKLSPSIKNRLVLENDDMSWSVHDLLPICKELNIPFVLDYHHHNIIFDADKIREGSKDIVALYPQILETWRRKNITPKMHYSEPTPKAITGQQRRKHNPRVYTLPPCPDTMDLMIEAKDKEQAVFELMRNFKLPGFEKISDIVPYTRGDENKPLKQTPKKKAASKKGKKVKVEGEEALEEAAEELESEMPVVVVPEEEVGMGGPEGRVYWPPGMEEWLRPKKREIKKKDPAATPGKKSRGVKKEEEEEMGGLQIESVKSKQKAKPKKASAKKAEAPVPTPSTSDGEEAGHMSGVGDEEDYEPQVVAKGRKGAAGRKSNRAGRVSYQEDSEME